MKKLIFKCKFGSTLYGTTVETSDNDYKGIFIPDAKDIVMQRVKRTVTTSTKKDSTGKNTADDVDTELFSLQEYMRLLLEGQTIAIDMIFAPRDMILSATPVWSWIVAHRQKFLHKGVSAFIGYCRQQANKYGIKGSRIAAMRSIVKTLESLLSVDPHGRLYSHREVLVASINNEFTQIIDVPGKNEPEPHLEVCNRKVPLAAKIRYAYDVYKKVLDQYGHRALQAEKNEGIDWKALMHAVRVIKEGKELLTTGNVTFPCPERELMIKIRKGELPYNDVADIIEKGFKELEEIAKTSVLPEEPDTKFAEKLIYSAYSETIFKSFNTEMKL